MTERVREEAQRGTEREQRFQFHKNRSEKMFFTAL